MRCSLRNCAAASASKLRTSTCGIGPHSNGSHRPTHHRAGPWTRNDPIFGGTSYTELHESFFTSKLQPNDGDSYNSSLRKGIWTSGGLELEYFHEATRIFAGRC